jgi:hypothetical protein
VTTTERPGPRSLPACDQVLHPPWCDRARCGTAPGIDASHRTTAWRLIPARHFDNEVSVSSEHDVVPHERRHETCVELQVAHARCGRSPGDDPEAVTSLVRLSYVEALQVAAALIAHAHQLASDVDGRSIGVRSQ